MKTRHLQLVTHTHSVTTVSRSNVYSPYGPVRAGLTTSPSQEMLRESQRRQLMELLNSLESAVANLNYKSCTVLDTLENGTKHLRAQLSDIVISEGGTDE